MSCAVPEAAAWGLFGFAVGFAVVVIFAAWAVGRYR